jgi:hypothetical protein
VAIAGRLRDLAPISAIEEESSSWRSRPFATLVGCLASEAAATTAAWLLVADAVEVIDCAVRSIVAEGRRQPADEFADLGLEGAGELVERVGAAHLAVVLGLLLGREPVGPDHVVLEHLTAAAIARSRRSARRPGMLAGNVAVGKPRHPRREATIGAQTRRRTSHDEADARDQHGDEAASAIAKLVRADEERRPRICSALS